MDRIWHIITSMKKDTLLSYGYVFNDLDIVKIGYLMTATTVLG